MTPPEHFKPLEKIIEFTAEKQHKQIDNIHWSYSPKNEITASITIGDEIKQIIFTNDELLKTQTGNTPSSVLKKIEAAISLMPRNDPPPSQKIK